MPEWMQAVETGPQRRSFRLWGFFQYGGAYNTDTGWPILLKISTAILSCTDSLYKLCLKI